MQTKAYSIAGMTCNHCVMTLRRELAKIGGLEVESAGVGEAVVRFDPTVTPEERIREAVEAAGFRLAAA